jgi:hypothetical protein
MQQHTCELQRSSPAERHSASSADDAGSYAEGEEDEDEAWASGSHASSSDTFSEVGDPAATEVRGVQGGRVMMHLEQSALAKLQ